MTNPYESPQTPPDWSDSGPATGPDAREYSRGFLSALLITIVFTAILGYPLQMVLTTWLPKSLKVLPFLLSSPAASGPIFALILWLRNRKQNRPFAVGAVTFGVAAFLLVGGCFIGLSLGDS